MSIVDKLRELKLNKEDKLLRRYNLVDWNGLTQEGKDAVMEYMFKQVKSEIVADLQELEKQAKITKKIRGSENE